MLVGWRRSARQRLDHHEAMKRDPGSLREGGTSRYARKEGDRVLRIPGAPLVERDGVANLLGVDTVSPVIPAMKRCDHETDRVKRGVIRRTEVEQGGKAGLLLVVRIALGDHRKNVMSSKIELSKLPARTDLSHC